MISKSLSHKISIVLLFFMLLVTMYQFIGFSRDFGTTSHKAPENSQVAISFLRETLASSELRAPFEGNLKFSKNIATLKNINLMIGSDLIMPPECRIYWFFFALFCGIPVFFKLLNRLILYMHNQDGEKDLCF